MANGNIECDDRGRILLPKDVRNAYGEEFVLVKAPNEIVLIPVPKDPLKTLQEEGKKLPKDVSVAELKKLAHDLATEQALERARRHENLGKKLAKKKR
jgi:DNA-binding transcriptional regulator/RsmH inhibitor MraZ